MIRKSAIAKTVYYLMRGKQIWLGSSNKVLENLKIPDLAENIQKLSYRNIISYYFLDISKLIIRNYDNDRLKAF